MIIDGYTFHGGSCVDSKRVYSSAIFCWSCPKCKTDNEDQYNQSPLIYAGHAHNFYCDVCEYESRDSMYKIDKINDDSVEIIPSPDNNLEVYHVSKVRTRLK